MKTLTAGDLSPSLRMHADQLVLRLANGDWEPVRRVRDLPPTGRIALERATRGEPVADFDGPFSGGCTIAPGYARLRLEVAGVGRDAGLFLLLSGGFQSAHSVLIYDASAGAVNMIVGLTIDPLRESELRVERALHQLARSDATTTDPTVHARNAGLLLAQVQGLLCTAPEPRFVLIPAP